MITILNENYYRVIMRADVDGHIVEYDRYVSAYNRQEVKDVIEDQKLSDEKDDWIFTAFEIDEDEYLRNVDKQYN